MNTAYKSESAREETVGCVAAPEKETADNFGNGKEKNEADGFVATPLSEQARKKAGLCGYYRPYVINTDADGTKSGYRMFKRMMDVAFAAMALVVLSPVMLGFMLAVVIEDPSAGPIFRQKRIGMNGKPFTMYKLRSMRKNAEDELLELLQKNQAQEKAFKIKNDPRVTKVGKIARKICVDELFQLINVIKGDMSVVGPRPPLPAEVLQYDEYERQRLSVMPGLTCIWQVYPGRHEVSFDDWVAMDLKYRNEYGFFMDLKLIVSTLLTVISGNGD